MVHLCNYLRSFRSTHIFSTNQSKPNTSTPKDKSNTISQKDTTAPPNGNVTSHKIWLFSNSAVETSGFPFDLFLLHLQLLSDYIACN
jgi:hypothetical protein